MLGKALRIESNISQNDAIILGTLPNVQKIVPGLRARTELQDDDFWITNTRTQGHSLLIVTAKNDRGVLYGVFSLLSKIARQQTVLDLDEVQQPYARVRWVDQWDNLDGSIERGYAGRSIFFENGMVRTDLTRASEYARLLASVGIDGCAINNVNADAFELRKSFGDGECSSRFRSIWPVRKLSVGSTHLTRRIRAWRIGGAKRLTRFMPRFRTLAVLWSKQIPKAGSAPQLMGGRKLMRQM